jgi:hypothetical protein
VSRCGQRSSIYLLRKRLQSFVISSHAWFWIEFGIELVDMVALEVA